MHHADDLIKLFIHCFMDRYQTQLAYGVDEPLYEPAHLNKPYHMIYFAHGFFSSALHECAHWLLAGKARRTLADYGYWYIPDGRTPAEQVLFQQVEVKPQALEWLLCNATGYPFQLSFDNLNGTPAARDAFQAAVTQQMLLYQQKGLPMRAQQFHQVLFDYYQGFGCASTTD